MRLAQGLAGVTIRAMRTKFSTIAICLLIAQLLIGCGNGHDETRLDKAAGFVTRDHQLPPEVLLPVPARVDWEFDLYYLEEHLVFLPVGSESPRALTVSFRYALNDSDYRRAERDFSGFYFDGKGWRGLPYTRARQDSVSLLKQRDYYFGGLVWNDSRQSGLFYYDRNRIALQLEFEQLLPVQSYRADSTRVCVHAVGHGRLTTPSDTLSGLVYYRLTQLEGYNPITKRGAGLDAINNDWLALVTESGEPLLAVADSDSSLNQLHRNFLAYRVGDSLRYAEGSDQVRVVSSLIRRDPKIYDYLALEKSVRLPELGVELTLKLTESRFFYTSGFCLALIEGELRQDDRRQTIWGLLEHWQPPKADPASLK